MRVSELRCTNCHALVAPERLRGTTAVRCEYCGAALVLGRPGSGALLCSLDPSADPPAGFWVNPRYSRALQGEIAVHVEPAKGYIAYVLRTHAVYDDFDCTLRIRLLEGDRSTSRAGLLFRHEDDRTFGMAWVSTAGTWYLGMVARPDVARTLAGWSEHDALRRTPGEVNEIGVRCEGSRISMSINGVHAATAREPGLRHGPLTVAGRTEEGVLSFAITGLDVHAVASAVAPSAAPLGDRCEVLLQEAGPGKIQVIKVMREHAPLGLKECKDLIDAAPVVIVRDLERAKAERLRDCLAAVGATAVVR